MNRLLKIPFLFILTILTSAIPASGQKPAKHKYVLPTITYIDTRLPLTFSNVNYNTPGKTPGNIVEKKIINILIDFYEEFCGDTPEECTRIKESYFRTLRTSYNNCELYIVILNTPATEDCHCRLFLYNPITNCVSKKTIDFNIFALYTIENNKLSPSNLKLLFQINTPDIKAVGPKMHQYLILKRLAHNGTFNAIERTTFRQNGVELDNVSFESVDVNLPGTK